MEARRSGSGDSGEGSHAQGGGAVPFYRRLPLPLKARRTLGGRTRARSSRRWPVDGTEGVRRGCVRVRHGRGVRLPRGLGVRAASGAGSWGGAAGGGPDVNAGAAAGPCARERAPTRDVAARRDVAGALSQLALFDRLFLEKVE
jgi:hypothetical protein